MASVANATSSYAKAVLKKKDQGDFSMSSNNHHYHHGRGKYKGGRARSVGNSSSTGDSDGHDDTSDWPELSFRQKFVAAPPPKENPWHTNPNAAAVIAMKFPQSHFADEIKGEDGVKTSNAETNDSSSNSQNVSENGVGENDQVVLEEDAGSNGVSAQKESEVIGVEEDRQTSQSVNSSRGGKTTNGSMPMKGSHGKTNDIAGPRHHENGHGGRGRGNRNGSATNGVRTRGGYHGGGKGYYVPSHMYYPERIDTTMVHLEDGADEFKDGGPAADYASIAHLYNPIPDYLIPYPAAAGFPPTAFAAPLETAGIITLTADEPYPPYIVPAVDAATVEMLRNQIEYYFSEENLSKDFYLRRNMDREGFLPVHLIASFHRVKSMTEDYSVVVAAIQSSDKLELTEDFSCVRTMHNPTKWPIVESTSNSNSIDDNSTSNTVSLSISLTTMKLSPLLPSPATSSIGTMESEVISSSAPYVQSSASTISLPSTAPSDSSSSSVSSSSSSSSSSSGGVETLNPNVPEFVPKSKQIYIAN